MLPTQNNHICFQIPMFFLLFQNLLPKSPISSLKMCSILKSLKSSLKIKFDQQNETVNQIQTNIQFAKPAELLENEKFEIA